VINIQKRDVQHIALDAPVFPVGVKWQMEQKLGIANQKTKRSPRRKEFKKEDGSYEAIGKADVIQKGAGGGACGSTGSTTSERRGKVRLIQKEACDGEGTGAKQSEGDSVFRPANIPSGGVGQTQ